MPMGNIPLKESALARGRIGLAWGSVREVS